MNPWRFSSPSTSGVYSTGSCSNSAVIFRFIYARSNFSDVSIESDSESMILPTSAPLSISKVNSPRGIDTLPQRNGLLSSPASLFSTSEPSTSTVVIPEAFSA